MSGGILGDLFDLDGSGELDLFEQTAELAFLASISEGEDEDEEDDW